jgi:hypothetical protein
VGAEQNQDRADSRDRALLPLVHDGDRGQDAARRERFRCELHEENAVALVSLHGELDLDTIDEVQEVMA